MKNAYYIISSLPSLKWGGNPPMSSEEFLALCSSYLSDSEMEELKSASITPRNEKVHMSNSLAFLWHDHETFLRNRIAKIRGKGKSLTENRAREEKGFYAVAEKIAHTALANENPLEKEKILDLHRWKIIEDLSALHQFDFDAIVAYKLKLQLLEKSSSMNRELGLENLNKIKENILKKQELS
ncbi:MAG TPA: DUF2764 family protein [Victivallales bacterium]|nr:DUF2764 family protein [Victivallales bacterium]